MPEGAILVTGASRGIGAAIAMPLGSIFVENIAFLTGETIYLDGGQV